MLAEQGDKVGTYKEKNNLVLDQNGEPIKVIWRIETNNYEYSGYDAVVKGTKRYFCYGPSAYGAESWD